MKKTWVLLFLFLMFLPSCKKKNKKPDVVGMGNDIFVTKFIFMDSTGRDYLIANNLKPSSLFIENVFVEIHYELKNSYFEFTVEFYNPVFHKLAPIYLVHIGNKILDTITISSYPNTIDKQKLEMPDWLIDFYEKYYQATPIYDQYYLGIYELFYNGKLLTPPQVDKNGDWVTHRIVVKEDF